VCFVAEHPSSGQVGGAEVAMSILANELASESIDVHYASMKPPEVPPPSIQFHRVPSWTARAIQGAVNRYNIRRKERRDSQPSGVRESGLASGEHSIAGARAGIRRVLHMTYMRGYESSLSDVGADIFIQVCAGRPTGYVANFCKKRGKPFIFRSTSLWDADLTFKWGWKSWRDYTKEVYLQGVRQADIVAANSENTARIFVDHIGKEKVRFLPDGFHMPPCPDLSRRDGYVLWVGRDAPYKRPQLFADLAQMLPKYRFVMVGDIRSMNSPPANLLLLGPKKPDELSEIYSQAGLLVNTSEVEGFPNVLVEAGIHGVPYVGFLDPDNVVREYSLGLHARGLDEMARMTETLMDSQDLRFALGKNARRFAEERHDIRKVTEKWLLLFEEMTGRQ